MQSAMRRSFGAAVVLVVLSAFSGSAEAVMFNNVEAWWNSLNCDRMNAAVNAYDPVIMASGMNSGYCVMYAQLGGSQKSVVNMAAREIGGDYASIQLWWEALDCRKMSIATGYAPRVNNMPGPYCRHFANAPKATATNVFESTAKEDVVAVVGYALATGMMATAAQVRASNLWRPFMAAPALPLVGAGLLGLLLAGRGAWLRRRRHV